MNAQTAIAGIVVLVWAATFLYGIVDRTYQPPTEVNSVMMLVAGGFFAAGIRRPRNGENGGKAK